MFLYYFFLLIFLFLSSCSYNVEDKADTTATIIYDDVGYDNLNNNYLLNDNELTSEFDKKFNLFPDAYKKSWLINEIQQDFKFIGQDNIPIKDIPELYLNVVASGILTKVFKRAIDFEKIRIEKYNVLSCNINYEGIKKGDILLSVTRNSVLMAMDGENVPHHALLCVDDPTSDNSKVFLTTLGADNPVVALYPLSYLKTTSDIVVVLRVYNGDDDLINKVVEFGLAQIGKGYNMNTLDKITTEKYYCNQLVWRAYYEGGIDIDCNSDKYYDYGIVLATDIYKSPYLYIVKYSY